MARTAEQQPGDRTLRLSPSDQILASNSTSFLIPLALTHLPGNEEYCEPMPYLTAICRMRQELPGWLHHSVA